MAWRFGLIAAVLVSAAPRAQDPITSFDVTLTLRIAGPQRQFHPGETIPIELEFSSRTRGRLSIEDQWHNRDHAPDEFRVDPDVGVADPMLDFLALGGCMDCGYGIGVLDGTPYVVTGLELNNWFRFDGPGRYRVSVRSNSIRAEHSVVVPVTSNTITVDILPRDERWEAEQVEALTARIDSGSSDYATGVCRALSFLGTHAAVDAMIRRFDNVECQGQFVNGLFGAPDREYVVRQMAGWIAAPDQSVSEHYVRILAILSVYLDHPELRPAQTAATKGHPAPRGAIVDERDLINAAIDRFRTVAAAARANKEPRARALTVASAFQSARPGPERDALRAEVVASFLDLPPDRQRMMLENTFLTASPAMIPVVRRLSDSTGSPTDYAAGTLGDLALRRWWQLAPAEARAKILERIAKPSPGSTIKTLRVLPDDTLPSLDADLAANLLAIRGDPTDVRPRLFERYATGTVEGAAIQALGPAIFRHDCETVAAIVAYLARVDPAQGREVLGRVRATGPLGCGRFLWLNLEGLRMSSLIEEAAIEALLGTDPEDVNLAAGLLRTSGSASAREPLLRALERWHTAWAGRADALRSQFPRENPNGAQARLETVLTEALAYGSAWHATAAELAQIRQLCVTDGCKNEMAWAMEKADRTEIQISYLGDPDCCGVRLAQYYDIGLAGLEARLRQYPKGTVFTLDVHSLDEAAAASVRTTIAAIAKRYGLVVIAEKSKKDVRAKPFTSFTPFVSL